MIYLIVTDEDERKHKIIWSGTTGQLNHLKVLKQFGAKIEWEVVDSLNLEKIEMKAIATALAITKTQKEAAKLLGISERVMTTKKYKLLKYLLNGG